MDVTIQNEGTIVLFHLLTPAAEEWVDEHVPEDAPWFGAALVVEHRYAADLGNGMAADGLEVGVGPRPLVLRGPS
jgi:hypothetical protein